VPSLNQSIDLVTQPETVTDTSSWPLLVFSLRLAIRSSRFEQQSPSSAALTGPKVPAITTVTMETWRNTFVASISVFPSRPSGAKCDALNTIAQVGLRYAYGNPRPRRWAVDAVAWGTTRSGTAIQKNTLMTSKCIAP